MSFLNEEVCSLVRDKYLFFGLRENVKDWTNEQVLSVYNRIISVYDAEYNFDADPCSKKGRWQTARYLQRMGMGHLVPNTEALTQGDKIFRIITTLEDRVTAKYNREVASRRIRTVIKQEQMQMKNKFNNKENKVEVLENWIEQKSEPKNIDEKLPDEKLPETFCEPNPKDAIIIPQGRQLPRSPLGIRTGNSLHSNGNVKVHSVLPTVDMNGEKNVIPSGKQIPRTPKSLDFAQIIGNNQNSSFDELNGQETKNGVTAIQPELEMNSLGNINESPKVENSTPLVNIRQNCFSELESSNKHSSPHSLSHTPIDQRVAYEAESEANLSELKPSNTSPQYVRHSNAKADFSHQHLKNLETEVSDSSCGNAENSLHMQTRNRESSPVILLKSTEDDMKENISITQKQIIKPISSKIQKSKPSCESSSTAYGMDPKEIQMVDHQSSLIGEQGFAQSEKNTHDSSAQGSKSLSKEIVYAKETLNKCDQDATTSEQLDSFCNKDQGSIGPNLLNVNPKPIEQGLVNSGPKVVTQKEFFLIEEKPLPVTGTPDVINEQEPIRESQKNIIPQGKQLKRTPTGPSSVDQDMKGCVLVDYSVHESSDSTCRVTMLEPDLDYSLQIFVKGKKSGQKEVAENENRKSETIGMTDYVNRYCSDNEGVQEKNDRARQPVVPKQIFKEEPQSPTCITIQKAEKCNTTFVLTDVKEEKETTASDLCEKVEPDDLPEVPLEDVKKEEKETTASDLCEKVEPDNLPEVPLEDVKKEENYEFENSFDIFPVRKRRQKKNKKLENENLLSETVPTDAEQLQGNNSQVSASKKEKEITKKIKIEKNRRKNSALLISHKDKKQVNHSENRAVELDILLKVVPEDFMDDDSYDTLKETEGEEINKKQCTVAPSNSQVPALKKEKKGKLKESRNLKNRSETTSVESNNDKEEKINCPENHARYRKGKQTKVKSTETECNAEKLKLLSSDTAVQSARSKQPTKNVRTSTAIHSQRKKNEKQTANSTVISENQTRPSGETSELCTSKKEKQEVNMKKYMKYERESLSTTSIGSDDVCTGSIHQKLSTEPREVNNTTFTTRNRKAKCDNKENVTKVAGSVKVQRPNRVSKQKQVSTLDSTNIDNEKDPVLRRSGRTIRRKVTKQQEAKVNHKELSKDTVRSAIQLSHKSDLPIPQEDIPSPVCEEGMHQKITTLQSIENRKTADGSDLCNSLSERRSLRKDERSVQNKRSSRFNNPLETDIKKKKADGGVAGNRDEKETSEIPSTSTQDSEYGTKKSIPNKRNYTRKTRKTDETQKNQTSNAKISKVEAKCEDKLGIKGDSENCDQMQPKKRIMKKGSTLGRGKESTSVSEVASVENKETKLDHDDESRKGTKDPEMQLSDHSDMPVPKEEIFSSVSEEGKHQDKTLPRIENRKISDAPNYVDLRKPLVGRRNMKKDEKLIGNKRTYHFNNLDEKDLNIKKKKPANVVAGSEDEKETSEFPSTSTQDSVSGTKKSMPNKRNYIQKAGKSAETQKKLTSKDKVSELEAKYDDALRNKESLENSVQMPPKMILKKRSTLGIGKKSAVDKRKIASSLSLNIDEKSAVKNALSTSVKTADVCSNNMEVERIEGENNELTTAKNTRKGQTARKKQQSLRISDIQEEVKQKDNEELPNECNKRPSRRCKTLANNALALIDFEPGIKLKKKYPRSKYN